MSLWDKKGGKIQDFNGHRDFVRSAVFSPDGRFILTASDDGLVKLWPLTTTDNLMKKGCEWLQDYLTHDSNAPETLQQYCKVTPNRPRQNT